MNLSSWGINNYAFKVNEARITAKFLKQEWELANFGKLYLNCLIAVSNRKTQKYLEQSCSFAGIAHNTGRVSTTAVAAAVDRL